MNYYFRRTEPGSLSTSLGLLSNFGLFMVVVVVLVGFRNLETMECALSQSPLSLPLSSSIVLLCCESSLNTIIANTPSLHCVRLSRVRHQTRF